MDLKIMLDQLSEYQSQRDVLGLRKQELIDTLLTPEIKWQITEIEAEFQGKALTVDENINILTADIKEAVITCQETVKGSHLMAVFVRGRVTWDGKRLDGMMSLIPALRDARKEGDPSVTIRRI